MSSFLFGAGRAVITPEIGTHLYGYEPNVISTSVHDDLTATVLAVGSGKKEDTALLFSLTLGDIQTEFCDEMRAVVSKATGISKDNIIMAGTHTHSAPNVSGLEGWGGIDRPYIDSILLPAIQRAAKDALASMTEAEMGVAVGESKVGINRCQQQRDGVITLGQNPWGTFDPYMTVAVFRRKDDHTPILNLIHYGCHGTASGKNHEITRDWSGMMIDRMEQQTHTMTVFFNGAIGDVGPRLTNGLTVGDITFTEELGSVAAMDAMRIFKDVRTFCEPEVMLHKGTVHLPRQPYPTVDFLNREIADLEALPYLWPLDQLHLTHDKDVRDNLLAGITHPREDFTFEQTLVQIGPMVFIPFPFEPFSEIVLRLREYAPTPYTLSLSCCNGYNGYLPTESALCRGGYEIGVFRYALTDSLADNSDQHIIDENLRILNE